MQEKTIDTLPPITDFRPGSLMNSLHQGVPAASVQAQALRARNMDLLPVNDDVGVALDNAVAYQNEMLEQTSDDGLLELQHNLDRQRVVHAGLALALEAYVASHALFNLADLLLDPKKTWQSLQDDRDEMFRMHDLSVAENTPDYSASAEEYDFTSVVAASHVRAATEALSVLTKQDEGFEEAYGSTRLAYTLAHNGVRRVVEERCTRDGALQNDEQIIIDKFNADKISREQLVAERARLFGCSARTMRYEAPTDASMVGLERLEHPIRYRGNARLALAISALAIHTSPGIQNQT